MANLVTEHWFPYKIRREAYRFVRIHHLRSYHALAKFSGKVVVVAQFKDAPNMRRVYLIGHGTVDLEPGRSDIMSNTRLRTRPANWDEYLKYEERAKESENQLYI